MKPTSTTNLVLVRFTYYSDVLDSETEEFKQAEIIDEDKGLYRLASIPHYGAPVSLNDTIQATVDPNTGDLTYEETVENSGNSTIQIVLLDEDQNPENFIIPFQEKGCTVEQVNEQYFVMNIPAEKEYATLKLTLQHLEDEGVLSYAEPWLAPEHQSE